MDEKIGNVTIHKGTRYGGAAQRTVTFGYSEEFLLRRLAEKRYRENKKPRPSTNTPEAKSLEGSTGTILLVDVGRVQWVALRGEHYYDVDSGMILRTIKNKGLAQIFWPYRKLYGDLAKYIRRLVKSRKIELQARFSVTATGTDPRHKKEFGTLIKLSVAGNEFVLPNSFPRDFKEIILESHP